MALLCKIVGLVLLAPFLLRLPIAKVDSFLTSIVVGRIQRSEKIEEIVHYTDAVCGRLRRFVSSRCLARGLTLVYLLRKAGLPVGLAFGMEQHLAGGKGHCWLVLNGEPFAETVDPREMFTTMYSIGGSSKESARSAAQAQVPLVVFRK